ncbi:vitamin K epoxide reductase family protein [Rhodococcus ruber]|uniref:Vitamin K epoxide reductase family protein n=1 Tax=Rhodococcus ruber TaxID=1830 RepID=A0ABT4ML93_9NOCA|nr:vitamin K epoxide reductase family protein [Rhodococcus ruber]MCZ4521741.1 vitamin K epoxide reductase family protein [Rhodococcus ruber]
MTDTAPTQRRRHGAAGAGWGIFVAGTVGLLASLILVIERYELLLDPSYVPSCSLNPVLSCGSVMTAPQAALLGFPNPIIGIPAFSVVVVTGVLILGAVAVPRWYWIGLAAGLSAGVVFVHWLIFESLYRIGALCPYCMAVWAVTIPLWLTELARASAWPVLRAWTWPIVAIWYTVVVLLCIERFWEYWRTLL